MNRQHTEIIRKDEKKLILDGNKNARTPTSIIRRNAFHFLSTKYVIYGLLFIILIAIVTFRGIEKKRTKKKNQSI